MTDGDANTLAKLIQGCESEQLHLSGAIQAFGAMLRIDAASLQITHASANLEKFTGISAAAVLGRPLEVIPWLPQNSLARLPLQPGKTLRLSRVFEDAAGRVDAVLIRGETCILVEVERNNAPAAPITLQHYQRPLMTAPHDSDELADYHKILMQAFRDITGFERIMIYRFREDWAGEVIAEMTTSDMGSYLDLRFPASDIPAIARNLYMINPSRMIPDAGAEPVPILGIHNEPPDMTWSDLRSVSPVHLQYLANMGIGASFSVPIRVVGKLWGLVACHHRTAHILAPDQRDACVTLTGAYAIGLSAHMASHRLQIMESMAGRIDRVLEKLSNYPDPLDGIQPNGQALIEAVAAQGFAMAIGDNVAIIGEGPDLDGLSVIDDWFLHKGQEPVFSTDCLAEHFPASAEMLTKVSGVMAIKARSLRHGWVRFYWFRPAEPQVVAWAGNPNKPVIEDAGAIALSPRRSFERWVETRSNNSRSWSNEEKLVASKFRSNLLRWL